MKKFLAATMIAVSLMFATACSSGTEPAPTVTVTASAPAPAFTESQDDKYLSAIRSRSSVLYSVDDATLLGLAQSICTGLNAGIPIERVLQIGLDSGLDQTSVAAIAAGAVVFYCPGADER